MQAPIDTVSYMWLHPGKESKSEIKDFLKYIYIQSSHTLLNWAWLFMFLKKAKLNKLVVKLYQNWTVISIRGMFLICGLIDILIICHSYESLMWILCTLKLLWGDIFCCCLCHYMHLKIKLFTSYWFRHFII